MKLQMIMECVTVYLPYFIKYDLNKLRRRKAAKKIKKSGKTESLTL